MSTHNSNTPKEIRDLWRTPKYVFDALDVEFNFMLDVAANIDNRLCPAFFSESMDALNQVWPPVACWCNPPYSNVMPWVVKAHEAAKLGSTVVMLIPADTSVAWFRMAWATATEIRFISGRLSFINDRTKLPTDGNNKGSALFIWRPGNKRSASAFSPIIKLVHREELKAIARIMKQKDQVND